MDALIELDDPSDWPDTLPHMRELDQLLRCPVCKEYFATAMVTANCGHTFCSLCVRRCLTQETKCPSCRAPLTESELNPNRLIDSAVHTFKSGRLQLLAELKTTAQASLSAAHGESRKSVSENSPKRRRIGTRGVGITSRSDPSIKDQNGSRDTETVSMVDLTTSDVEQIITSDMDITNSDDDRDARLAPPARKRDSRRASNSDDSDFMPDETSQSTRTRPAAGPQASVPCPNCQGLVRQARINWHLDRCLAGKSTKEPTTVSMRKQAGPAMVLQQASTAAKCALPRPTKLAYSLLSESKLRRTLKDLGIPTKGDKQQMQARHVEWVNLYMANADASVPVSHRLLLRRLATWEESLARPADNSKPALETESDVAEHAAKYADSFAALVAQASAVRAKPAKAAPDPL
ncbi:E3 ubiquitin-protein ligase rad18 [Coemansia sp. S100]|nr:E3 ubiquitin-protein ligase rad18 [Coemansia sp. S17]KAJ2080892.1 E3 ubiquitin-protein ligase rad18 [Coemansia sp. S100]